MSWKYPLDGYINNTASKVMTLGGIKRSNAGLYACVVSNSAGKAEDTVTVNVFCEYKFSINCGFIFYNHNLFIKTEYLSIE